MKRQGKYILVHFKPGEIIKLRRFPATSLTFYDFSTLPLFHIVLSKKKPKDFTEKSLQREGLLFLAVTEKTCSLLPNTKADINVDRTKTCVMP